MELRSLVWPVAWQRLVPFLQEALVLLPAGTWLRTVRADSGFFDGSFLDVPGYTFQVWVTNRSEAALELWRDYNGRACVEQRIEELKHDLAADEFCLQPFFATESAFLAVLFTFKLLSLYQHQTTPDAPYRQPGTLRVAVFLCGAVLGVMSRDVVIKLSAAWGGLRKHKPLVAATLDWLKAASPKFVPPLDRLAIGGGMI